MSRWKDIFKDWRIMLYFAFAVFSFIWIAYSLYPRGVVIVRDGSIPPGTKITAIGDGVNFCQVHTTSDYYNCLNEVISTCNNCSYVFIKTPNGVQEVNLSDLKNAYVRVDRRASFGIDIAGGTRIILKPETPVSFDEMQLIASVIENRANSYGLKQMNIRVAKDTNDNYYLVIEVPTQGAEILDIIKKQGKFEAKIGNITIFTGKDIKYVFTDAQHSRILGCSRTDNGYVCRGAFQITISKEAAAKFAEVTKNLSVVFEGGESFLSKDLELYLDGELKSTLKISADLKGKAETTVSISVTGSGASEKEARENTYARMKELQVLLSSGSLPTKLDVVRIERISPTIGSMILDRIIFVGIIALLSISALIFAIYRRWKVAGLLIANLIVEISITLALGMLVGQTLDIPSLAGVLIAIGTGIDDQIVAVNEILRGKREMDVDKKVKKVNFIIIASFLTTAIAVLPLIFAGLGLLRGFAVMTLIGIFIGAFITRPAFVRLAEKLI